MLIWDRIKGIATERQGNGVNVELSLVRDPRGNLIDEATGEIYARANEPEEADSDEDD